MARYLAGLIATDDLHAEHAHLSPATAWTNHSNYVPMRRTWSPAAAILPAQRAAFAT
jgi:hypothetical protein